MNLDHLPTQSVSEIFVEAASALVEEQGFDLNTDQGKKLRAEVIRHYEHTVHECKQSALFSGVYRETKDIAPEKIKNVNSYMRGWLANFENE